VLENVIDLSIIGGWTAPFWSCIDDIFNLSSSDILNVESFI